ncbi:MAG: rod shape-determining protein, partial [Candidatus Omnitrophica bacterium]|nr:rod shape-determining protein [Candidatus Omnitrophota bacterium]
IFKDNVLQSYDKVAFGGENLTRAIVKNLKISPAFAEEIKRSYVVALESERHQEEEILVKQENEYKPIRRCAIYEAIQEELETLLDQITAVVECSHMRDYLTGGVYAIGGGALLSGLMERIESSVNLPVQLGKVQMLSHKNVQNTALYAPVIGLACGAYKNTFGYSVSNNEDDHWTARIVTRMRELYQEYF